MRLTDASGQVLELEIVGYQFPDEEAHAAARVRADKAGIHNVVHDRHDDNWLIVRGHIETPRGSWDFLEPCLETWDLREISGWFQRAAAGETCGSINFTEPNISFEAAERQADGRSVRVVASFALESRPPWAADEDFQTSVVFVFTSAELVGAAKALIQGSDEYPER